MYEKKFNLTSNVLHLNYSKSRKSEPEVYFGVPWSLRLELKDEYVGVFLKCKREKDEENPWSIDVTVDFQLVSSKGIVKRQLETSCTFTDKCGQGCPNFVSWEDQISDKYSVFECNVVIKKTTGLAPMKRRNFEEPKKHLTDVILKVEDQKFHVSKAVLANQSPYFEALFFGNFDEAKKEEIELKETAVDGFQSFLEIIYGNFEITVHNVTDLLILGEKFDVQVVRNRCEEFLKESDQVKKNEKLVLADAFKLENLMKHYLESMKNPDELKIYLPKNLADLSSSALMTLFEKILTLC